MKNWKLWILLAAAMTVAASCWKENKHRNQYSLVLDCNFEYVDVIFDDDSVFVVLPPKEESQSDSGDGGQAERKSQSDFTDGRVGVVHFYAKVVDDAFVSGFCLAGGVDPLLTDHEAKTAFHTVSHQYYESEKTFVVFREGPSMPEKIIEVNLLNEDCHLEPQTVLLNNTHRFVRAAKFGTGLADGAFGASDWAAVTFTGYLKGTQTGEVTLKMADGSNAEKPIVTDWTELKLTDLGQVDEITVKLTSSRADMVKDVCIDHLLCSCYIEY